MTGLAVEPTLARPLVPGLALGEPALATLRERARPLPASARNVFETLAARGALTHKDLLAATGLPGRTVRYAVARLKDAGLVDARFNLADARQSYYFLTECPRECAVAPRGARLL